MESSAKELGKELGKAQGPATILAIGTANPANFILQEDYPEFYFRVTKSDNMTLLKEKFKRFCNKTMIRKRHLYLIGDLLERNLNVCSHGGAPSPNARQDILKRLIPELGKEAALKAIEEWSLPKSKITHLIFHSPSGDYMPDADCQITKLLGLQQGVERKNLKEQGFYIGGSILRVAKEIAEKNPAARILVVCSEIYLGAFRGPSEVDLDSLRAQAILGDGAAALIIGADPDISTERPLFELISSSNTIIPDSDGAIEGRLREMGLSWDISNDILELFSGNIDKRVEELLSRFSIGRDRNSLFWAFHTCGRAILDEIEAKLGLNQQKLNATRHVLSEYGNMEAASVFFVLDEIRRRSVNEGNNSTIGGREWGILLAFGAGLTLDAVLLRRFAMDTIPR